MAKSRHGLASHKHGIRNLELTMNKLDTLSTEVRKKFCHDIRTILVVLRTALTMLENQDEEFEDLVTMLEVPKDRLTELLRVIQK